MRRRSRLFFSVSDVVLGMVGGVFVLIGWLILRISLPDPFSLAVAWAGILGGVFVATWEARHNMSWVSSSGVRLFPFVKRLIPVDQIAAVRVNLGAVGLLSDWSVVLVMKGLTGVEAGESPMCMDCYTFGGASRQAARIANILDVERRDDEIVLPEGRERGSGLPGLREWREPNSEDER